MKITTFILMFLLLTGCLKSRSETNASFEVSQDDLRVLKNHCEEIKQNGDILELLKAIKLNVDEVFRILDKENPDQYVGQISILTGKVSELSKKVISLARDEWTISLWQHQIYWNITPIDFGNRYMNMGFAMKSSFIHSIYLQGEKRDDLKNLVNLDTTQKKLTATYMGQGSSLELCQLQKTMVIIVGVKFKALGITRTQYFNLYVKNELTRNL